MKLNRKQIAVRGYYLAKLVSDYFGAFRRYPSYKEIRVFFFHATLEAKSR
jgi:hypothetical protein